MFRLLRVSPVVVMNDSILCSRSIGSSAGTETIRSRGGSTGGDFFMGLREVLWVLLVWITILLVLDYAVVVVNLMVLLVILELLIS